MEFTWNPVKAKSNLAKHGVSFGLATQVFSDPDLLLELERHVEGEERWQAIGLIGGQVILLVAHTSWDEDGIEIVRIISARRAEKHECKTYEEQRRQVSSGPA